jgi:hypothetical protein
MSISVQGFLLSADIPLFFGAAIFFQGKNPLARYLTGKAFPACKRDGFSYKNKL